LVVGKKSPWIGTLVKLACGGLILAIAAVMGFNWYAVHRPLTANLAAKSPEFAKAGVFAHLGGFFQPGTLIVQVYRPEGVTEKNFPAFVAALAQASPSSMGQFGQYDIVALGGLFSKDLFITGSDWSQLAQGKVDPRELKAFLIEKGYMSPQEKIAPRSTHLGVEKQEAIAMANWKKIISRFVEAKPKP
jgi:hypothetical protein